MIRRAARFSYFGLAWLFVLGIMTQVFFAGMGIFGGRSNWETHSGLGHFLGLFPLVMLAMVFVGGYTRAMKGLTGLLFMTYLLMADFVIFIRRPPFVAAVHPVLAMILFATAVHLANKARGFLADSASTSPSAKASS